MDLERMGPHEQIPHIQDTSHVVFSIVTSMRPFYSLTHTKLVSYEICIYSGLLPRGPLFVSRVKPKLCVDLF